MVIRKPLSPMTSKHAKRIQARATRRCGQLREAYKLKPSEAGARKGKVPEDPSFAQRQIAEQQHGISPKREKIAVRAANIPAAP
jgi:hypothetical protein